MHLKKKKLYSTVSWWAITYLSTRSTSFTWWKGRPGVLQFMGLQRVEHNWVTELSWTEHTSSSVQFSCLVVSDSLQPHILQNARPPCPSPTPRVYPNSCPLSRWCHPTISSSVIPFSSCLQSSPASWSFQMSQLFASGGQSIGVSASTSDLLVNTQGWSPSGRTGWISLQSKGLSRVFSSTTVQKHQFFCTQLSLQDILVVGYFFLSSLYVYLATPFGPAEVLPKINCKPYVDSLKFD